MPKLTKGFRFHVVESPSPKHPTRNAGILIRDNWDDHGHKTSFDLTIYDAEGNEFEIGYVKISLTGLGTRSGFTELDDRFATLEDGYFSLGQNDTYYENLNQFADKHRILILDSLRDVAFREEYYEQLEAEPVKDDSLFRTISAYEFDQFKRIAQGKPRLTPFRFSFQSKGFEGERPPPPLEFRVIASSLPPTNVHAIIGRNGSGKTHTLNSMQSSLLEIAADVESMGHFQYSKSGKFGEFANLVSISFSAFDESRIDRNAKTDESSIRYVRIGLNGSFDSQSTKKTQRAEAEDHIYEPAALVPGRIAASFVESLEIVRSPGKRELWEEALVTLEADPGFEALNIRDKFSAIEQEDDYKNSSIDPGTQYFDFFQALSSGHQIVLLSITKLVHHVEQNSLVLIDEPETHLHPPLLAAFIRSLSDLLHHRNGVAIVATHSPVVLQEVPKNCVWILDRIGSIQTAERPDIETFGENLGILTRKVFGYSVYKSGFHQLLREVADQSESYEEALMEFSSGLGGDARAILRSMFLEKERGEA